MTAQDVATAPLSNLVIHPSPEEYVATATLERDPRLRRLVERYCSFISVPSDSGSSSGDGFGFAPLPQDPMGPCYPWTGATNGDGYGYFSMEGRSRAAHVVGFELVMGRPVLHGKELDHICHRTSGPFACLVPSSECPHRRCQRRSHWTEATHPENAAPSRRQNGKRSRYATTGAEEEGPTAVDGEGEEEEEEKLDRLGKALADLAVEKAKAREFEKALRAARALLSETAHRLEEEEARRKKTNAVLAQERHEHEKVVANLKMDVVRLSSKGGGA